MATQMYWNSYSGNEYVFNDKGRTIRLSDRETLAAYDPGIKRLIDDVFPCQNRFVTRCAWKGLMRLHVV